MSQYDAIVIGGGMGGQVCANYLAKAGKRTLLLEQNHQTGGNMSGFWRKGFYFDGGVQSFESLGVVFPILKELGVYKEEEWTKASFRMVSDDFDFVIQDLDQVEAELQDAFPDEPGIGPLFAEIKEVSRFLSTFYDPWTFPLLNDFSLGKLFAGIPWLGKLKKWTTFAYREKACSVIQNPRLREWFTNIGYYQMPFLFFAGFWHIWANDYWYPRGGMQSLHNKLAAAFEARGGQIAYNSLAKRINVNGKRATGVECADGRRYEAEQIVYAGDYKELVSTILGREHFSDSFGETVENAKLTEEIVSVYLGLRIDPQELAQQLRSHHPFYFPNYQVIFPDAASDEAVHQRMWVALNFYGAENPELAPSGKSTLVLQTYSSFAWQDYWNNGSEQFPRSGEYQALKERVGWELVRGAEKLLPGLSEMVEYMEVGTPLSLRRFTRNSDGATGGWCYREDLSPVFRLPQLNLFKTPIKNVHAAGHYSLWPGGVISAALSGRLVANRVLGRPLLTPIGGAA